MKKQHYFWILFLGILAAYFLISAFIPLHFSLFRMSLWVGILFLWLAATSRSFWMAGVGVATLSLFAHDTFHLTYAKWPLFFGIVLIGIILGLLLQPKRRPRIYAHATLDKDGNVIDGEEVSWSTGNGDGKNQYFDHEKKIYARTTFSNSNYYVTSQQLNQINIDANYGELEIDLRQAQFMTDRPTIDVQANFGEVTIRIPGHWRIVHDQLVTSFSEFDTKGMAIASDQAPVTIYIQGKVTFGGLHITY